MFSPNQLYDYLRYYCHTEKKDAVVRSFVVNGSKNLDDLTVSHDIYTDKKMFDKDVFGSSDKLKEQYGCIDMFDQEPVDINAFYNITHEIYSKKHLNLLYSDFQPHEFVFAKSMSLYTPIICHSEQNSNDIALFNDNFYTPVHFWSNAILSRYWFAHYELLQPHKQNNSKRFGAYIRETNGTRGYRKDLLNFLKTDNINKNTFCPYLNNNSIDVQSHESANITWDDHNNFDIHIVPETLFDTEKVHLTEKLFKPIVMYQPFIILSGHKSLEYIRSYGFKTFNDVWDESYDNVLNTECRFKKITDLITSISNLNHNEYTRLIEKTIKIVEFNRNHFYSEKFKNALLSELKSGIDNALEIQEENFYAMPGGTLFFYHDLYYKRNGHPPKNPLLSLHNAINHAKVRSEKVSNAIVKKYSHLL
jgi:hypothetical protein